MNRTLFSPEHEMFRDSVRQFIETEMAGPALEGAAGEATRAQSPFHRVATPQEVAAAVVTLASPGAEWASGAVLDFNGASHLR